MDGPAWRHVVAADSAAAPEGQDAAAALGRQIDAGKLTISKVKPIQQGYVVVSLPGLTAKARVRVLPGLPYTQDFSKVPDGAVPAGWVNTQGKFLVKTLKDGSKVLAKVNTNSNPLMPGPMPTSARRL